MNNELRKAFDAEMASACRFYNARQWDDAFRHLERAHILGQNHVLPHVRTHWMMLLIGVQRRSATEVWGQATRMLLGALGSVIGVVPSGNTGGTNISMFKRLPIDVELKKLATNDD